MSHDDGDQHEQHEQTTGDEKHQITLPVRAGGVPQVRAETEVLQQAKVLVIVWFLGGRGIR
ncbi:hypothetical protein OG417_51050 [Actinoallomurus sp. NBC_01490]|uniref:hypothetical protein n=1 Tax=Actinoallomurus sp. NBC_01490 TaxID=2903557 RepID=UPI002E2F9C8F|nr:hypothetical protein [Actinoallomurus sp. NBC_01490]